MTYKGRKLQKIKNKIRNFISMLSLEEINENAELRKKLIRMNIFLDRGEVDETLELSDRAVIFHDYL